MANKYTSIEPGQIYGELLVLEQADDYVSPKGKHEKRWKCKCSCGNEYITRGTCLKTGRSTSCGCISLKKQKEKMTRDLTGQRFGRLVALRIVDNEKRGVYWRCQCDCGTIIDIRGTALTSGNSTSCGCFRKEKLRDDHLLDLCGQRFGKLVVVKQVEDAIDKHGKHRSQWLCHCDCGNDTTVVGSWLTSGNTTSCGCYKLEMTSKTHFKNLTGQRFGMLTVLRRVEDHISLDNQRARVQYLCRCDCGNEKIILGDSLYNGTISCGCINSKGERDIANYLREKKIPFKIQYTFPGLVGQYLLKFDFAVFDNNDNLIALIEYQGEQHYGPVDFFGGTSKFKKQQEYDKRKRSFCKDNNINLIEVPYWIESISTFLNKSLSLKN